jgi:hypothetical protein
VELVAPALELVAPALELVSPAVELVAPAVPTGVPLAPAESSPEVSELPPHATTVATPAKKNVILAVTSFIESSTLLRGGGRKLV